MRIFYLCNKLHYEDIITYADVIIQKLTFQRLLL